MLINIWKKNWIWMTAVVIGLLGAFTAAGMQQVKAEQLQRGIAHQIIRFHVLANSDSVEDQSLKLEVKNTVVAEMEQLLQGVDSVDESRTVIQDNLSRLQNKAAQEIRQLGYHYPVTAALTETYFPQKTYGDCTFPEGYYEALQIKIGNAAGRNWWCVVYPSLCFTDSVQGVVSEEKKEELKKVLTEEEYENILHGAQVKISFKWLK